MHITRTGKNRRDYNDRDVLISTISRPPPLIKIRARYLSRGTTQLLLSGRGRKFY